MEVILHDEAALEDARAAFTVEVDLAGLRLDEILLAKGVVAHARELRRLVAEGRVRVHGRAVLGGAPRLPAGARVVVLGPAARPELLPERIPLAILHEDPQLLVVDKPAGLPVAPGTGHPAGTLANALRGLGRPLSALEGPLRPGIVHRLDAGTSGAMVIAKSDAAHTRLAALFLAHEVTRRYLALVAGAPAWDATCVAAPLGRRRDGRKAQGIRPAADGGRPALTRLRVALRLGAVTLVEAAPETGRKHQIRVHLAALGHPVVGDSLYGGGDPALRAARALGLRRPALHAVRLALGAPFHVDAVAPVPPDLAAALALSGVR